MKRTPYISFALVALLSFFNVANTVAASKAKTLSNFHQVDERLYRGAQPSKEGIQELKQRGIKTVINLRDEGDEIESERVLVEGAGMQYYSLPISGSSTPSESQVARIFALIDDPANGAIFIHCKRGADRTGTVSAIYRVSHQGWSADKAVDEAMQNGMRWYFFNMRDYIRSYAKKFAAQRERLGRDGLEAASSK